MEMREAAVTVTVDGELNWHGYVVSCGDCGAREGLQLRCGPAPRGDDGEVAGMVCPDGHEGEHPLVYPAFVRQLDELGPGRQGDGSAVNGWEPHLRVIEEFGIDAATMHYAVLYPPVRAPHYRYLYRDWRRKWPELAAVADSREPSR